MNPLNEPDRIIRFLAGMFSVQVWQWIKCKWKDHTDPEGAPHRMKKLNAYWVAVVIVLAAIAAVSIQNYKTYTFAERLAQDTRACQIEFNQALLDNRKLNADDRKLDVAWQSATFNRARDLTALSRKYGSTSDQYLILKAQVDAEYFGTITKIEEERRALDAERAKVPYPLEPTCGK